MCQKRPFKLPRGFAYNSHLETHLRKKQKAPVVDRDGDLYRITEKLQVFMGPLGKAWEMLDGYRNGEVAEEDMIIDLMVDQLP